MSLRCLSLIAMTACTAPLPFEPAGPAAAPDPSTFGPFEVGVRTVTFTDVSRTSSITGKPRQLVTEIWYPAEHTGRAKESYRLIDAVPADFAEAHMLKVLGQLDTEAVRDAPALDDFGPYPLVVFSHGNGGIRMQSTFLTVALASHGYVVASPDHEGNTLAALLAAELDTTNIASTALESYLDRPADMRVVIDRMLALGAEDPLAGLVDPAKIGIAGHSLGAVTSLRTASLDRRIGAVVAEAPAGHMLTWIDLPRELASLGIPVQVQGGLHDEILPADVHTESYWDVMTRPRFELVLPTAGHFTFSDLCAIDRGALESLAVQGLDVRSALDDGCGADDLDAPIAQRVLRHFGVAMFNGYLRGSPGSLEYLDEAKGRALGASELRFRGDR